MKLYTLYREQTLNISLEKVWNFFSSPENLKKITPGYMGFEIISDYKNEKMYPGMIIEYIVKPVLNFPMRWVTEITHVKEHEYFIDEQRFGPYKFWHHLHQFKLEAGKLIMIDRVNYALPLGLIGRIAHSLFVRNRIEAIFNFRSKILKEIFSSH